MEDIEEVALIPVPDPIRGEEVKAYVVLRDGLVADEAMIDRIIDYACRRLATFKVPRYLEFIDIMPRTTSFKVAKSELAAAREDHRIGSYDRVDRAWR
jgi:crotonobetaine/carnitine-CoA ligase